MSEWPVVVARPLDEVETSEVYLAFETRRKAIGVAPPLTRLLTALAEGRICIEQDDEPTAEELRDDHDLINDDHWYAMKEGDRG